MAAAGLGDDLLLANQVLGKSAERLGALAKNGTARVTVAVDSDETVDAAARAGIREVLIDVNVGMPRCGCDPGRCRPPRRPRPLEGHGGAGRDGLRGPSHDGGPSHQGREGRSVDGAVAEGACGGRRRHPLRRRHRHVRDEQVGDRVAGGIVRAHGHRLRQARQPVPSGAVRVRDGDLGESIRMGRARRGPEGHRDGPRQPDRRRAADLWFVSDEHTTYSPADGGSLPKVGDRVRIVPRTSIRRSRSTSACTSSTATTSSRPGTSTYVTVGEAVRPAL